MGWTRSLPGTVSLGFFLLGGALHSQCANAITLAPIAVRSYMGQNLSVEIDILNVEATEESSLRVGIAIPKIFADLNMDYTQSIGDAQIELLRRPDGTRYIKLRSARSITEPFVDLVLEVSTSAAKLVRPYRLLLDPPASMESLARAPELAEQIAVPVTPANPISKLKGNPLPNAASEKSTQSVTKKTTDEDSGKSASEPTKINVRPGDTAGKIAATVKPQDASIEQTLIALLQSNPHAFTLGNVNRLQSGTVITVPKADTVNQINRTEARARLAAQALAFNTLQKAGKKQIYSAKGNEFSQTEAPQTVFPDTKPLTEPISDSLKLSKNTKAGKKESQDLEEIARQKNKQSEIARAAELAKNIQQLAALAKSGDSPAPAPNPVNALAPGALNTSGAMAARPSASAASDAINTTPVIAPSISSPLPQATAQAPPAMAASATPAPPKPTEKAPTLIEEPSYLSIVVETTNEYLSVVVIALAALGLGAAVTVRSRKKKRAKLMSGLGADGEKKEASWNANTEVKDTAYGGDQIDTSLSNSKIHAENTLFAAELDPVAEADVYLAYGKDEPAEEILREGLMQDPRRVAIHVKLAEIYAARQDYAKFAICAEQVEALAGTAGTDWAQIQTLGQSIEPTNPRYHVRAADVPFGNSKSALLNFDDSLIESPDQAASQGVTSRSPARAAGQDPVLSFAPASSGVVKNSPASASPPLGFDLGDLSLALKAPASLQTQSYSEQLETSMELARQFIEIGELEGARSMLNEVIAGGSDNQRKNARAMLAKLKQ